MITEASNNVSRSGPARVSVVFCCLLSLVVLPTLATADVNHEYTVTVGDGLNVMTVEAHFGIAVDTISARSSDAGTYLNEVNACGDPAAIRMRNRRMLLPEGGIRCLRYTVDLRQAAQDNRYNRGLADDNIVVSPAAWLWRPPLTEKNSIHLQFQLPESVMVSVPWQAVNAQDNSFQITNSPENSNAPAVFGNFEFREIDVSGVALRLTVLKARNAVGNEDIAAWLSAAATDVSLAYGRFPNPAAQIVVYPVGDSRGRSDSPVPFGRVVRDGGETVELFVNENRALADYLDDWTATHEFSHLMLPYLGRKHRWVAEGFAQYYQNVLLARSGAYDELRAWQKIYEGLERGRLTRPELSPNDAAVGGIRNSLMKVYWSGAAIALMADVTLRKQSAGQESLDTVLDRFQSCCLPTDRQWTGEELFRKFDELAGTPVFMPLYRRYADTAGFPDITETFAQLGIEITDNKVSFNSSAKLHHLREAITQTDEETARWRQQLTAD